MLDQIDASTLKKYDKYNHSSLMKIAVRWCHDYIRARDNGKPCVNCGKHRPLQAGHFFAAGKYNKIRFCEYNIHGECLQCNYYNSQSHAHGYAKEIVNRIGKEDLEKLELKAVRGVYKYSRFELIGIIEYYKRKLKELKWK